MKRKRLALNSTTIRHLGASDLKHAIGGARGPNIHETEPYSACGMCVPITYMSCQC